MSAGAQSADPEGPHPLAQRLAAQHRAGDRVLVVGPGRGRSLGVLEAAGLRVETATAGDEQLLEHRGPYGAILSTHALLHGTRVAVARRCALLLRRIATGGRLYATFGSKRDPRYGAGTEVSGGGWAPTDGDEAGVAHAYFDRATLLRALAGFHVLSIEERDVGDIAGRWAHPSRGAPPAIHWFVEALKP